MFIGFIEGPPAVHIRENIVRLQGRLIGGENWEVTMSVRDLERATERGRRALDKYSRGSEVVVIDD